MTDDRIELNEVVIFSQRQHAMARLQLSVIMLLGIHCLGSARLNAGPAENAVPPNIGQLIAQLGSLKFKEREAAAAALETAGIAALPALQAASINKDPEIRRRAEKLLTQFQKRQETAEALKPTLIHLDYDETPLAQAVADLARQSGFPIQLASGTSNRQERAVTLRTDETTFWQALDLFCAKTHLVERVVPLAPDSVQATDDFRAMNGAPGGRIVYRLENANSDSTAGRLFLVDGQVPACPTCYAGAVRIRAVTAADSARSSRGT